MLTVAIRKIILSQTWVVDLHYRLDQSHTQDSGPGVLATVLFLINLFLHIHIFLSTDWSLCVYSQLACRHTDLE